MYLKGADSMMIYLKTILISLVIFIVVDLVWLVLIVKKLYQSELEGLMRDKVNLLPAIIFYIIFLIALSVFVIVPAINDGSLLKVVLLGALFGLVTYGTYDLTNYATLDGFPLKIVLIDLAWGTFLGTVTSTLTYLIYRAWF